MNAICSWWRLCCIVAPFVLASDVLAEDLPAADLVIVNGKVMTLDDRGTQVTAVAVQGDNILATGSDEQVRTHVTHETQVIDANGRLVIPGFIESHAHFTGIGFAKMMLDLRESESWDAIIAEVAEAARTTPDGEWIVGRGWHQEKWRSAPADSVGGYPTHAQLTKVSPRHPVLLTHASGHMSIVNAEAMRLARIDAATQDPNGGEILKDSTGEPTGVLRETAQDLALRVRERAASSDSAFDRAVQLAAEECLAKGITSFQDAGSPFADIDRFQTIAEAGRLPVRLWVMVRDDPELMKQRLSAYRMIDAANGFLTVRTVKQAIDGALGSHGAWLLEPYDDLTSSTGLNTTSLETLADVAALAVEEDFQLCVHAIGDRANREVLDLYERTFARFPREQNRRWRIEHAQHLHPDDISRFADLGVVAAMQGVHCTSDAVFVATRLGQRRAAEGAYVWRDLLDRGVVICNGTDAPVEDVNPIASFYSSVTRRVNSQLAFYPQQAMTRAEALNSYTRDAAYAAFEEDRKGSLVPGKLADIVVLSQDILACPEESISGTAVEMTIVGGQIKYQKNE